MIKAAALTILLLGDLNFTGLQYMTEFSKAGYDPGFSFKSAVAVIKKADIAIANLEGPLTFADWSVDAEKKTWRFRQLPVFAKGIKNAGIKILLLANNHIADAGEKGIEDTFSALKDARISWAPSPREGPLVIKQEGFNIEIWNVDVFSPAHSHPWAMKGAEFAEIVSKKNASRKDKYVAFAFIHDHPHGQNTEVETEKFVAKLRASGIHWVIIGGEHKPAGLKTDSRGGVHHGLGDFIFGCECSGEPRGKALSIIIGPEGVNAKEIGLELGSPNNGYVTTFDSPLDFPDRDALHLDQ